MHESEWKSVYAMYTPIKEAYRRKTAHTFREMRIQSRPEHRIQSLRYSHRLVSIFLEPKAKKTHLEIPRTRPIEQRQPMIHHQNHRNTDQEPRQNNRHQHNTAHNLHQRAHEHPHSIANLIIYHVHVFAESVHDATEGSGVEEGRGSVHDARERVLVQSARGVVREEGEDEAHEEEAGRLAETENGVDGHVDALVEPELVVFPPD